MSRENSHEILGGDTNKSNPSWLMIMVFWYNAEIWWDILEIQPTICHMMQHGESAIGIYLEHLLFLLGPLGKPKARASRPTRGTRTFIVMAVYRPHCPEKSAPANASLIAVEGKQLAITGTIWVFVAIWVECSWRCEWCDILLRSKTKFLVGYLRLAMLRFVEEMGTPGSSCDEGRPWS